eukprot:1307105-Rhodomonas_salina.6
MGLLGSGVPGVFRCDVGKDLGGADGCGGCLLRRIARRFAAKSSVLTRVGVCARDAVRGADEVCVSRRMLDSLSKVRGDQLEGDILKFPIKPARKDDTDTPARDSGEKEKRDTDE